MIQGKDREESIRLTAEAYNLDPIDAAEIVDISEGWSEGDDVANDAPETGERPTPSRDDADDTADDSPEA